MLRDRLQPKRHQRAREAFEARIATLFDEVPALSGFYVDPDLSVTELAVNTWEGWTASPELSEDIGRFLRDLVEDQPEIAELVRGRTFARSFQ
jgi:hypothetical protein